MTERTADDCAVLIVDVAGSATLRRELGDVAAGRKILHLLDSIIASARTLGASFIKAYGDDILAVFETGSIAPAADLAVRAQNLASEAGLQLYAGFHAGSVQFRQTDGHLDAVGQTINFVARLHKLTEDVPGQVFIVEETVKALPAHLRSLAFPFGQRLLKGIGKYNIWTLDWNQAAGGRQSTAFFSTDFSTSRRGSMLTLRHRDTSVKLGNGEKKYLIGRGAACSLIIPDPGLRISTSHLTIECADSYWFLQDISRNGTWMKTRDTPQAFQMPYCQKAMLPRSGAVTLGRPPADDPGGLFTITFSVDSA